MKIVNTPKLESNISQILAKKKSLIFEDWKSKVHQDQKILTSETITESELNDDVDALLDAIIKAVDTVGQDDFQEITVFPSLCHTRARLKDEYAAVEIAREYSLLKKCIFAAVEDDLSKVYVNDVQIILQKIDSIFDDVICSSFDYFFEQRTQRFRETENELIGTNKELSRLININRDNFSYLAHDFKTPLNSIMGYAQILLRKQEKLQTEENKGNTDETIAHINRMLSSSRFLLQMVNDLLEVFRCDKGEINLKLTSFDIRLIINNSIEDFQPLAEEKGIKIIKKYENAPQKVISSIPQMQKNISNLLSNAIHYTDTGEIIVRVKNLPDNKWLLSVEDTGIGIAKEDQEKIFQPFFRTSDEAYKLGSTGLGLAIVKQSVELLQGEIELVSELNKGSSFMLTFPLEVVQ